MAVKSKSGFNFSDFSDVCSHKHTPPKNGFSQSQFIVMALGNIIGSGIFLASGAVLAVAGPWTPLAYFLGGLIMIWQVSFVIEMTIAHPAPGAFKVHAQQVFGSWWGYTIGWTFWTSGVLGMASEVTACALLMRLWFSSIPLWIFSLFFSVLITTINLNDAKGLSKIEFGLASIKIVALLAFICMGIFVIVINPFGSAPSATAPFASLFTEPLNGIQALMASMVLILFSYTGTGIIGLSITETTKPEHIVPQAARFITFSVTGLYTLAAILLVILLNGQTLDQSVSPFVSVLNLFTIPYASDILNFILVTAALSSLNSQVYSASRMLLSLAMNHEAPRAIAYKNQKGVPTAAVILSGSILLLTVLLSYILPEKIFIYTISASGVLALVNWMSVSATHYFYRQKLLKSCPNKLKYQSPGYPYISWITFLLILLTLATAPLYPEQLPGLYASAIIMAIIAVSYLLLPKRPISNDN